MIYDVSKDIRDEFMVSPSAQCDVHVVNYGPIRGTWTIKQGMLEGGAILRSGSQSDSIRIKTFSTAPPSPPYMVNSGSTSQ